MRLECRAGSQTEVRQKMQHSTWDDDDMDTDTMDDTGDDTVDWEDFDRSIRSDEDAWCERVGAHRD